MFKEIDYDKNFVIGTPLVGWKCDKNEDATWLENRIEIMNKFKNASFFAAFELDHRGLEPFTKVINLLNEINGEYWTYTLNDKEEVVSGGNRLIRIEMGRNLVREYTQRKLANAVLYIDSDMCLTPLIIEKMFEVDRQLVGVDVPAYGLNGKQVNENPLIQEHWTTAGMLLVNAPAYHDLPWGHNLSLGLSDDPAFQYLAERLYGQTWVRKDIQALHAGQLLSVENRGIPKRSL